MTEKLTPGEIQQRLKTLEDWHWAGDTLRKQYEFVSFKPAIHFVNRVAELAEAADHHPDITIHYRKVTLSLTTHSAGGLTLKDFTLAGKIDAVVKG